MNTNPEIVICNVEDDSEHLQSYKIIPVGRKVQEFDVCLWNGFPSAKRFKDGKDPVYCHFNFQLWLCYVDASGIYLYSSFPEDSNSAWFYAKDLTQEQAIQMLKEAPDKPDPSTHTGWKQIL